MQKQFLIFLLNRGLQLKRCLHTDCSFLSSILSSLLYLERHGDNTASEKGMLDLTLFLFKNQQFLCLFMPLFLQEKKKRGRNREGGAIYTKLYCSYCQCFLLVQFVFIRYKKNLCKFSLGCLPAIPLREALNSRIPQDISHYDSFRKSLRILMSARLASLLCETRRELMRP